MSRSFNFVSGRFKNIEYRMLNTIYLPAKAGIIARAKFARLMIERTISG